MKTKVTAVCTHEGSHLINLTFITKEGNPITMYQDCNDPLAGDFANFTALYTTILLRAKWNNFIIPSHKLFGHRVYNIIFINPNNPSDFAQYPYYGKEDIRL